MLHKLDFGLFRIDVFYFYNSKTDFGHFNLLSLNILKEKEYLDTFYVENNLKNKNNMIVMNHTFLSMLKINFQKNVSWF